MLLPVLGMHVGALLLIMASHATTATRAPERRLAVFDIAALPDTSRPTPAAADPIATPLIVSPPAPILTLVVQAPLLAAAAAPSSNGIDCDLTNVVEVAVRQSPPARSALLMLPRNARSVANAVMLWDGEWTAGTTTSTRYALGKIREVVLSAIGSASPDCRAALQAGPRLAIVPGAPDIVIAFGSGRWRWGDLGRAQKLTVAANEVIDPIGAPQFP
jgi:hypothetical protein